MLIFTSGPGTVIDPDYVKHLDQPKGMMDGVKVIQLNEDHRLFLQGEFGNFRIYAIVTYTRPEIIPSSVKKISSTHFQANVAIESSPGTMEECEVAFRAPIAPYANVRAAKYGMHFDSFEFAGAGPGTESFVCDLSFITNQAENCPPIPLKVEYIGIAKSERREAQDRLGEGHEKLQKILAEHNRRPSKRAVYLVLYRPSELDPPLLSFPDVIEIIEGTMIQHFKPTPLNVKKLNFPNDSPDLLEKVISIGSRDIATEVTSPRGTILYTDKASPGKKHLIKIHID